MNSTIPTLPLPMIGALVLLWLLIRRLVVGGRADWFSALLLACGLQSLLVALTQAYGLRALAPVQPLTAALIPPLAWMALVTGGLRAPAARDLAHLWPIAAVGFSLALWRPGLDAAIFASFAGYGAAILWTLRSGVDALPLNRLQGANRPALVWRLIGLGLILSATSEVVITLTFALGHPEWIGWVIGLYAAGLVLAIGVLSLSASIAPVVAPETETLPDPMQDADDAALVARLTALLAKDPLHRDPDLTLGRLARRLGVPAKALSSAINRHTGGNVSRLINTRRIDDACARLTNGATLTAAMLDAGFNTKSNFNREFKRVTGQTPRDWRAAPQT